MRPARAGSAETAASTTGRPVVVTQGDPTGVGPELVLRLAADGVLRPGDRVIADRTVLQRLRTELGTPWAEPGWQAVKELLEPGLPTGLGQVEALRRGVDLVLASGGAFGLVTAPIDKAASQAEGLVHPGHTEYLAERAGGVEVAMLMVGPRLRVVLATVHVPLASVPARLNAEAIVSVGALLARGLVEHFGIASPRIGVMGLNPHAGERGLLGDEETRIIAPAIERLRARCGAAASFEGPVPADTAFHAHLQGRYDGLVAMYHDQGLGPFKLLHFYDGVNMTLGLPFVRTSPDHGTARDIAGRGIADASSMRAAVEIARGTGS